MKKLKKLFPQKVKNIYHLFCAIFWVLYYRYPAGKLKVIGVTGTDGKTTTSTIIYHILKSAGKKVTLISTVTAYIGDEKVDIGLHVTSPNPRLLQKLLRKITNRGYEFLVLEATSHGLDQHRLFGISFYIGVLTNITDEHFDYHKTYKDYVKAKSRLFNKSKLAILNKDDKSFKEINKYIDSKVEIQTYDKFSLSGDLKRAVYKRFSENYNKENARAAILVAREAGVKEKNIINAVSSFPGVSGRLEEIVNKKGVNIYIDFAHTPNSLKNVLRELKVRTKGKLIVVFGCAGERDFEKRDKMGFISAKITDVSIFTAEDPRNEDVNKIISQMIKGAAKTRAKQIDKKLYSNIVNDSNNHYYISIPERGEAISFAIQKLAQKGDTVVVCGKGHEKSMCYNGIEYSWSDHEAVRVALKGKVRHIKKNMNFQSKNIAVIGLGIEGKDLVNFLLKNNDVVTILDAKDENEIDFSGIDKKKVELRNGKTYLSELSKFDIVFRSPGVYRYKKEIVKAEKKGVLVSSAIKLFFDLCPGKVIGVTGTKGKGTTATLIYEILKESGKDVFLAGNIGKPFLELLPILDKDSWIVLEMSSFQLIDLYKSPHIAVILNITSDHMDWHLSRNEYIDAKQNIVRFQKENDFTVINTDYKLSKSFSKLSKAKNYYFSKLKEDKGCYVQCGKIILNIDKEGIIGKVSDLILRGEHNWENVTAAVCAAKLAGADIKSIKKAAFSFKGLKHRLEFVGNVDGVGYYNDSFATGPQPTIAAIKSFKEPISLILGGFDKGLNYDGLFKEIVKSNNIENIILIGDLSKPFKRKLKKVRYKNKIINLGYSRMDKIVRIANKITPKSGVVLLSPAAASFDMFNNYKDRGDKFKQSVETLNHYE